MARARGAARTCLAERTYAASGLVKVALDLFECLALFDAANEFADEYDGHDNGNDGCDAAHNHADVLEQAHVFG